MLVATEWLQAMLPEKRDALQQCDLAELLSMRGLESDWLPIPQADGVIIAKIAAIGASGYSLDCGAGKQCQAALLNGFEYAVDDLVAYCGKSGKIVTSGYGLESECFKLTAADAPSIGMPLTSWLGLDGSRLEVSPTPDRGDCLSILGLSRELAAALGCGRPKLPEYKPVAEEITDVIKVNIKPATATACYYGRFIRGVDITAPSPHWLKKRLLAAGIASSYCVVDVGNYIMLELGQPMHAFDAAKISGAINVRWAKPGESIELLDGRAIELQQDCLLIADQMGPLALAGIMGGANSAISPESCDIFLESALFLPESIIGRPMRYDLHTESAYRFERRVDSTVQLKALQSATALIQEIAGGLAGPVCGLSRPKLLPKRKSIQMHSSRLERVIGEKLDHDMVMQTLEALDMQPVYRGNKYKITPPPYRHDIENDDDVVAEVLRSYGYDRIAPRQVKAGLIVAEVNEIQEVTDNLSNLFNFCGYQEVRTSTFRAVAAGIVPEPEAVAIVANPMSERQGAMRTSLWPGLLRCLDYNRNRGQDLVRIFEAGTIFSDSGESNLLAGLASGFLYKIQWNNKERLIDFYDVKMDLQNAMSKLGLEVDFVQLGKDEPALHPGRSAGISLAGKLIGAMGELHPSVASEVGDGKIPVYLFSLILDGLAPPVAKPCRLVPRYPGTRRDLSLSVPLDLAAGDLTSYIASLFQEQESNIAACKGVILEQIVIFDVFYGDNAMQQSKSIAIRLIYRKKDDTMTDKEVDSATEAVADAVADKFGALRR